MPVLSIPPRHDRPGVPSGAPGLFLVAALAVAGSLAMAAPGIAPADSVRLAEARRLAGKAHALWPGWDKAPFAILLVTKDREFLVGHPNPGEGFSDLGRDPVLGVAVLARPRQFDTNLLATFPAFGALPTIVVGQAESTQSRTSTPWVVTLLHEHFHQWQMSQADYYGRVEALGLTGRDKSGSWMLNYPFPYDDPGATAALDEAAHRLAFALRAGDRDLARATAAYRAARAALAAALSPADFRYFAFQCWQEGISRYTEYRVADLAARAYKPTGRFHDLKDFSSFNALADSLHWEILSVLDNPRLSERRRVAFYAIGAGEGLLLDRLDPGWRRRYLAQPLDLGPLLDTPAAP